MNTVSDDRLAQLRAAAERARHVHYAPYSEFLVLAAAELVSGTIAGGSNVEVVNLTLTKHAEELAILAAFGGDAQPTNVKRISAVYVAGPPPCGSCRQFAAEFAAQDAIWIVEPVEQETLQTTSLLELPSSTKRLIVPFVEALPFPFSTISAD